MNEALRCDRMSMMHAGRVLDSDTPQALIDKRGLTTLEETFIAYLQDAAGESNTPPDSAQQAPEESVFASPSASKLRFSPQRLYSYARREAMELRRDPVRATLALVGTVLLMFIMGYGINGRR